jgi:hypothetical protein
MIARVYSCCCGVRCPFRANTWGRRPAFVLAQLLRHESVDITDRSTSEWGRASPETVSQSDAKVFGAAVKAGHAPAFGDHPQHAAGVGHAGAGEHGHAVRPEHLGAQAG